MMGYAGVYSLVPQARRQRRRAVRRLRRQDPARGRPAQAHRRPGGPADRHRPDAQGRAGQDPGRLGARHLLTIVRRSPSRRFGSILTGWTRRAWVTTSGRARGRWRRPGGPRRAVRSRPPWSEASRPRPRRDLGWRCGSSVTSPRGSRAGNGRSRRTSARIGSTTPPGWRSGSPTSTPSAGVPQQPGDGSPAPSGCWPTPTMAPGTGGSRSSAPGTRPP